MSRCIAILSSLLLLAALSSCTQDRQRELRCISDGPIEYQVRTVGTDVDHFHAYIYCDGSYSASFRAGMSSANAHGELTASLMEELTSTLDNWMSLATTYGPRDPEAGDREFSITYRGKTVRSTDAGAAPKEVRGARQIIENWCMPTWALSGALGFDSDHEPKLVLPLTFRRTGGIAGIDQRLVVWPDGATQFTARDADSTGHRLSDQELKQLSELLMHPTGGNRRGPTGVADGMHYSVTLGSVTLSGSDGSIDTTSKFWRLIQLLGEIANAHVVASSKL